MNARKSATVLIAMLLIVLTGCTNEQNLRETTSFKQADFNISKYNEPQQETEQAITLDENSTLEDYLTFAALNNPSLESAFNQFKASIQQIPQAGALDDPKFTYKYFIEEVETRVGPQRQSFGIAQTFPWFGRLQLKEDRAAQAARIKWYQYQKTKLLVFYEVRSSFFEYYYLSRAIDITSQNIELLKQLYQIASSRYTAALASHPDIIRAQLELTRVEDRLISLKQLKTPLAARLNAALNRPAHTPIPFPKTTAQVDMNLSTEEIFARLAQANPDIKTADHQIKIAAADIALAQKDYKPYFTLGLDFIDTSDMVGPASPSDEGKDPLIAMLSVNLPIWANKNSSRLSQTRLTRTAAVQSKQHLLNSLTAQTEMAIYKFQDSQRKIALYRDNLIPIANEALKVTQQAFQSGTGSFTDLIDSQRLLLQYQLALERAAADTAINIAEINKLIGSDYEIPDK